MKKLFSALFMTAVLLSAAVAFTGCNQAAQEPKEEPVAEAPAEETPQEELPFELGAVADGRYVNNWAGVSAAVPEGAQAMTAEEMDALLAETGKALAGESEEAQKAMDEHLAQSIEPLFMVDDSNDTGKLKIQYTAETLGEMASPEDYLKNTLGQLQMAEPELEFAGEMETVILGGEEYVHNSLVREDGVTVDYYVRQMQEKFIVLAVGYSAERAEDAQAWLTDIHSAE